MTRFGRPLAIAGVLLLALPAAAAAQSVQPFSLQGAVALWPATDPNPTFDPKTRLGLEAQLRYTVSRFSLGVGVAAQFPENKLGKARAEAFVEPRVVVATGNGVALYAAGRVGAGRLICTVECTGVKINVTYGGGAGVLLRLNRRLTADLGAQYLRVLKWSSSGYAMLRAGLGVGL
jgi:opacity protein-like surface antigen